MNALRIIDIKNFMGSMLNGELFDSFLFVEGDINMAVSYHIDGKLNKGFFNTDEEELLGGPGLECWSNVRGLVMQMVKGKRLPVSMKLVLQLKEEFSSSICGNKEKLFINIRYDSSGLKLITGVSYAVFTMERQTEDAWDESVKLFLRKKEIAYEDY